MHTFSVGLVNGRVVSSLYRPTGIGLGWSRDLWHHLHAPPVCFLLVRPLDDSASTAMATEGRGGLVSWFVLKTNVMDKTVRNQRETRSKRQRLTASNAGSARRVHGNTTKGNGSRRWKVRTTRDATKGTGTVPRLFLRSERAAQRTMHYTHGPNAWMRLLLLWTVAPQSVQN